MALLVFWVLPAPAQNLEGRRLSAADDLESVAVSVLGGLLGGKDKVGGKIDGVTVTRDEPQSVTLEVELEGFEEGSVLEARILDANRRDQRGVQRASTELLAGASSARLTIEVDEGLKEGTRFESRYVQLEVKTGGLRQRRIFRLEKSWQVPVSPENVVVRVTATPVGTATKLPPQQAALTIQQLPRVLKKPATTTKPVTTKPVMTRPVTTQPEVGKPVVRDHRTKTVPEGSTVRRTPPPSSEAQKTPTTSSPTTLRLVNNQQLMKVMIKQPPVLGNKAVLTRSDQYRYGLKVADQDKGARGPSTQRIDLLEGVRSDVSLDFGDILRVKGDVFLDANPNSGIGYYVPRAYHLEWDADGGYGMRMLYAASTEVGQPGDVIMATRLSANIDTQEVALARDLLTAYRARHPGTSVKELRALPLSQAPQVSLSGGLTAQFDIPPESIAVSAISDALGELDVSWLTDPVTKENIQLTLTEDIGLNGVLTFAAAGGSLGAVDIPVQVQLADPGTFGQMPWRRTGEWRNPSPYPLRLRYLHALLLHNNGPVIYSWDLGGAEVPPAARVEWSASRVPTWVDARAKRLWVDYSVVRDCSPCDDQVIAGITSGVSAVPPSEITFRTLTPLEETGAAEVWIRLRSRYFHPKEREVATLPLLVLAGDREEFVSGPVYLVDRQPGEELPDDPLFEYQLELLMPDGRSYKGDVWTPVDDLRVIIGSFQIRQQLGFLPGEEDAP